MSICWIVGGGRFGRRAAEILAGVWTPQNITVVDRAESVLTELEPLGVQTIRADGVEFLAQHLTRDNAPPWVVPSVPYHLYYRWLKKMLGPEAVALPTPDRLAPERLHPFKADDGGYYLTQADFFCPPDCPEPDRICTYTGQPRPGILYRDLGDGIDPRFHYLILRSHQLAPGLGGLKRKEMLEGLDRIRQTPGSWIIGTACKCHGVVHTLKYSPLS